MVIGTGGRSSGECQVNVKDPVRIPQPLIVLKPRLGKWILLKFEGTCISLIFSMIFSIISKISINVHEYGYNTPNKNSNWSPYIFTLV